MTLVILKDQTHLITQTEQLEVEPRVHLFEPYVVSGTQKITLSQWPEPLYTNEKHILIHTDSLLTVCDPTPELIELYLKKVDRVKEYEEAERRQESRHDLR